MPPFLLPGAAVLIGYLPMPFDPVHAVTLDCHPETPARAVRAVRARVRREQGGVLAASFLIEGDGDSLRVPPARVPSTRPSRVGDRLWEHTCCEIFIARTGLPAYHEFNFSPSGEWAAYAFERYREGVPLADESNALDPHIVVRCAAGLLELDVSIRLGRLSPAHLDARLSLALSAVVEERDGALSYWALKHPAGRPDFHHDDAYALELAETDRSTVRSSA
jgi:hypothetical protein